MKAISSLKDVVTEIYPLHRTLVSDGTDRALEIIGEYMPGTANYALEVFEPGKKVWTWEAPERYVVHEARLETEDGEKVVDFMDNPLHLVSYSLPIEGLFSWEELEPHLHYSDKRPHAIPWEFKYYERSWGFCLSKDQFDGLSREKRYRAVIRVDFIKEADQGLRIGAGVVHPEGRLREDAGEMLICSHVCHPFQANDDLSGVVTAIEVARRLSERPLPEGSMSVRFLFCPETIGSICYLSHHEDLIPKINGGIFSEMTGNHNSLVLQRTRQDKDLLDHCARYVLQHQVDQFREGAFREVVGNDEMVINGPGVNIPCISLSRWPYDEYHTSDDSPDIIHEEMLVEAADAIEEITRVYASNYTPQRTFRGPVFLSGHGLWVDWRENLKLNRALEKIMLRFEGFHSVFDIAHELELDYWETREYVECFRREGLVQALSIPRSSVDS
jgi:aminopeptidase-like protein